MEERISNIAKGVIGLNLSFLSDIKLSEISDALEIGVQLTILATTVVSILIKKKKKNGS